MVVAAVLRGDYRSRRRAGLGWRPLALEVVVLAKGLDAAPAARGSGPR